jgi:uncharacterized membrane protein (UPF0127 family)
MLIAVCFAASACDSGVGPNQVRVEIAGESFVLDIAADEAARNYGLKGLTEIPPHGGMLFVFPNDRVQVQSFWMEDCLVDMDIIFLDPQGRVTATHTMKVEPPRRENESQLAYQYRLRSYPSHLPAQFAIEVRAGTVKRLGVSVDQKIELDLPRLKAMAK